MDNSDKSTISVEQPSPKLQQSAIEGPYTAFTPARAHLIIGIVTFAGFLGPLAGNIYIPILPLLQDVFNVSQTSINGTVSVFMAVFAISPLFWAALADIGGRKSLYIISLVIFIIANVLLACLPPNIASLYVLRIVQAIGASSVLSLGAGTIADITPPAKRGKTIAIFMLGPQLGPLLGPILSSVASGGNWRWTFGLLSILTGLVFFVILFLLPETLRCLVGKGECYGAGGWKNWFLMPKLYQRRIVEDAKGFPHPPKLSPIIYWKLARYYPVLISSIVGGFVFASLYAISVTFGTVLITHYSFTDLQTSLSYIAPGIGLILGSLINGNLSDKFRKNRIKKNGSFIPEERFAIQIFGFIFISAGLIGFGWVVQFHKHVVGLFATVIVASFGITWIMGTNTTYLTECAAGIPASNVAFGTLMRNAGAAISSAIIHKLIEKMGYGWCFTGLGLLNLVSLLLSLTLYLKGKEWREKYGYLTK